MDIRSCRYCRKTFRGYGVLCPACAELLDSKYVAVRNYLYTNTDANIHTVSDETGVDEKALLFLIREGRITLRAAGPTGIGCLKCGVPVQSGKYCDKCVGILMKDFEATRAALEAKEKAERKKVSTQDERKGKIHILNDQ